MLDQASDGPAPVSREILVIDLAATWHHCVTPGRGQPGVVTCRDYAQACRVLLGRSFSLILIYVESGACDSAELAMLRRLAAPGLVLARLVTSAPGRDAPWTVAPRAGGRGVPGRRDQAG